MNEITLTVGIGNHVELPFNEKGTILDANPRERKFTFDGLIWYRYEDIVKLDGKYVKNIFLI